MLPPGTPAPGTPSARPTGLVSLELVSHTHSILGVDISQGMVDYYNARFAGLGHPPEKVHALVAEFDPTRPEESVLQEMKGKEFDLVYVRALLPFFRVFVCICVLISMNCDVTLKKEKSHYIFSFFFLEPIRNK